MEKSTEKTMEKPRKKEIIATVIIVVIAVCVTVCIVAFVLGPNLSTTTKTRTSWPEEEQLMQDIEASGVKYKEYYNETTNLGSQIVNPEQFKSRFYVRDLDAYLDAEGYRSYEVYIFDTPSHMQAVVGVYLNIEGKNYIELIDAQTYESVFHIYDGNNDESLTHYTESDSISIGKNMWINYGIKGYDSIWDWQGLERRFPVYYSFNDFTRDGHYLIVFGETED